MRTIGMVVRARPAALAANGSGSSQGAAARAARTTHPGSAAILSSRRATRYGARQPAVRGRGESRLLARIDQVAEAAPTPRRSVICPRGQGARTRRRGRDRRLRLQVALRGGFDRSRPCRAARSWHSGPATRQGRLPEVWPARPASGGRFGAGNQCMAIAWRAGSEWVGPPRPLRTRPAACSRRRLMRGAHCPGVSCAIMPDHYD